jgi:hypothetical protein
MRKHIRTILKKIVVITVSLALIVVLMLVTGFIWLPPGLYHPVENVKLVPPIMTLREYTVSGLIDSHPRPYVFVVESKKSNGAVLVFGAEHTFDPTHPQFAVMKENWDKFDPTVAMTEGYLDLIPRWFINGIRASGEGGYVQRIAREKGVGIYSWEAGRDEEVATCLKTFGPKEVTLLYILRRKQNQWSQYSESDQDKIVKREISRNSKYQGGIRSLHEVDSTWHAVSRTSESWRTYRHPRNGWPEGPLEDISEVINGVRDEHMCQSILELVNKGERVFITMGSSHAPRIEGTLKAMIQ